MDKKTKQANSLNTDIEDKKKELKQLKDDINQFPTEFSGFVTQGGKNVASYRNFSYIPIALILGLTAFLFWGTADLSAKYKAMPEMDLYTMLASRIPFALISGGIIIASYKLAKFLIEEIMKINRQRLNLTRVGIIANDITDTSIVGLDLNDNEIFELRTKLKMDMIRSHLKTLISDDYEYNIELSVWEKFTAWKKNPKIKADIDAKKQTASIEVGEDSENE